MPFEATATESLCRFDDGRSGRRGAMLTPEPHGIEAQQTA